MYGKLFSSMYDGTLRVNWKALVTMQQLIILSTPDGVVDMTAEAIADRTKIPLEIITEGLAFLESPDPYTRTPGEEGRRVVRLDDHRPWGWRLVNHAKYRALRNQEQKREADKRRMAKKRKEISSIAIGRHRVADVAHTDSDADANTKRQKDIVGLAPDVAPQGKNGHDLKTMRASAVQVIGFLNAKASRNYEAGKVNVDLVVARLREGATVEQCYQVVAKKCRDWIGNPDMAQYLRPATLFNRTKFAQYAGELVAKAA